MYPVLRAEMARRDISRAALAEMIGMPAATFYAKFSGRFGFSLEEATAIKEAIGVDMPIEELFEQDH